MSTIPFKAVPAEPHLSDLLDLLKKEILLGLNCHHIGKIVSFNSSAQTVVASVAYTKTFFQLNTTTGQYNPVQMSYPTLIDCPVIILGGGGTAFTAPIAAGNECVLLFNDRDLDNWWQSGQVGPINTARLHSFSDALCLVGVNSSPNKLTVYDAVRAVITNSAGTLKVGINPTSQLISIINGSNTLGTLLQTLANSVAIPGVPIATAVATQLATFME